MPKENEANGVLQTGGKRCNLERFRKLVVLIQAEGYKKLVNRVTEIVWRVPTGGKERPEKRMYRHLDGIHMFLVPKGPPQFDDLALLGGLESNHPLGAGRTLGKAKDKGKQLVYVEGMCFKQVSGR